MGVCIFVHILHIYALTYECECVIVVIHFINMKLKKKSYNNKINSRNVIKIDIKYIFSVHVM